MILSKAIMSKISSKEKIVYDYKGWLHLLDSYGLKMAGKVVDLMIVAFLTDCKIKTVDELINKYNLPIENDNNLFSNEVNVCYSSCYTLNSLSLM